MTSQEAIDKLKDARLHEDIEEILLEYIAERAEDCLIYDCKDVRYEIAHSVSRHWRYGEFDYVHELLTLLSELSHTSLEAQQESAVKLEILLR